MKLEKKEIGILVVLIIFAIYGFFWLKVSALDHSVVGNQDQGVESSTQEEAVSEKDTEKTEEIEEIEERQELAVSLESQGNQEAFLGYPLDSNFFNWLGKTYGNQTLSSLEGQLEEDDIWYQLTGNSLHVLYLLYCQDTSFETYRLEGVDWTDTDGSDVATIDMIGDLNLADDWYTMETLEERGSLDDCISPSVQAELKNADYTVINNEFVFSDGGEPIEGKTYTFRSKTENISYLENLGIDLASLANNHIYDFGETALLDTLDCLDEAEISHIGAGKNLEDASRITYVVVNGRKIAFVAATEIERYSNHTREATEDSPGVVKTLDPTYFCSLVEQAKANSDYVVAYVHWGTEGTLYPDDQVKNLAWAIADSGADLIVGDHSHRLQGMTCLPEEDGQTLVLYSLGNFWLSNGSLYTSIAQLRVDQEGKFSLGMLPMEQTNLTTDFLYDEEEQTAFYQYLADLSSNLAIDEKGGIYQADSQEGRQALYQCGQNYGEHDGTLDLEGRSIDIVGNLTNSAENEE